MLERERHTDRLFLSTTILELLAMLGPTLSLSQSQHLQMVMAPQLRQSLEMLQLPMLELRALIQQEIEQNPTIEQTPTDDPNIEIEQEREGIDDKKELDFDKEFEMISRLDDEWRDYFFQNLQNRPYTREDAEKRQFTFDSISQKESLQEHLLNQLSMAELSEKDHQIGEMVVGNINDDGYLITTIDELALSSNCDADHLQDILTLVQDFHPSGIAARDLSECLLLQLERLGKGNDIAGKIVRDHIDKLGKRKYQDIAKALKISVDEVMAEIKFITVLDPSPGRLYSTDATTYITPEILVKKVNGKYVVILNDQHLPHVRINTHYKKLINDPNTPQETKSYIREKIRAGIFLMKSIQQRQSTIERIATEIVNKQTAFLDHGITKLLPMTMASVAETVSVHETTVSRAVSGKYMRTPSGIFELKYFFTPAIKNNNGDELSNKTVKHIIKEMIGEENKEKPLSDQAIVKALKEQGIDIARRTVAKYRLVLHIPSSHMRKSY